MSDLAIISCHYNPCNYIATRRNYDAFCRFLKRCGDPPHYTVELSFSTYRETLSGPNVFHLRTNSVLWHKEALLNWVEKHVPPQYTKIAWIDTDVITHDKAWLEKTSAALDEFPLVQMFKVWTRLGLTGEVEHVNEGFAYMLCTKPEQINSDRWYTTGGAWAARREFFKECGVYDAGLVGSGDAWMACGLASRPDIVRNKIPHQFYESHYTPWLRKAYRYVRGYIGYVDVETLHFHHGTLECRNYAGREEISNLVKLGEDVVRDENGLWSWVDLNNEAHRRMCEMFAARKEDGDTSKAIVFDARPDNYTACVAAVDSLRRGGWFVPVLFINNGLNDDQYIDAALKAFHVITPDEGELPMAVLQRQRTFKKLWYVNPSRNFNAVREW